MSHFVHFKKPLLKTLLTTVHTRSIFRHYNRETTAAFRKSSHPTRVWKTMSSSEDEDEQLARAIAMSQASDSPKLSDAASRQETPQSQSQMSETDGSKLSNRVIAPKLDRKTMEQERLARFALKKRKGSDDISAGTDHEAHQNKKPRTDVVEPQNATSDVGQQQPREVLSNSESSQNSTSSFMPGSFPKGVIKRTWAYGYERDADIKIEEVLQKNHIRGTLVSSFMLDTEWLFSKFRLSTNMIMIINSKSEEDKKVWTEDAKRNYPTIQLCFPSLPGQANCMHSKLMLLSYEKYMRIVIPTANLTKTDWGESGLTENLVFLIDLPRLIEGQPKVKTAFEEELAYYLHAMDVPKTTRLSIHKFDFAETSKLAFIHTVAGSHFDEDANRTGFLGLAKSVRQLNLQSSNKLHLDYATSSLGALNYRLLTDVYKSSMGTDLMVEPVEDWKKHLQPHFRVFFPSHETVMNTKGKANAAGTICSQAKYWNSMDFPRKCMRDHESTRSGLLSHSKLLLARGECEDSKIAWAYVGSANLTESAWGKLVKDRAKKASKLNCRNWECGVLFPVADEDIKSLTAEELGAPVPIQAFEKQIKLPFKFPGAEFGSKEPWLFAKYHPHTFGSL